MASSAGLGELREIREQICGLAAVFDAGVVYPHQASTAIGDLRSIINTASALEASLAERVAQGRAWERDGAKSAEEWYAGRAGIGAGEAKDAMGTARRRKNRPELDAAARRGEISPRQAAEIGKAAEADPTAEKKLVERASKRKGSLSDLRRECEKVRANAEADPDASHPRRRAGRHLRKRTCDDGSTEVIHHSTPDETAEIWAACVAVAHRLFLHDRAQHQQRPEAHRMPDALLIPSGQIPDDELAGHQTAAALCGGVDAKIVVRVDHTALLRGHATEGETCEIAGIGPVPVTTIREMIENGDPFIAAIVTRVTHLPWLDRYCTPHHDQKTHLGWALVTGNGKRAFVPPDDPRHPRHQNTTALLSQQAG